MATFRKKRSRKYKRRNTRRNTRRKYIKARKSSINRRSRKSLVGGGILDGLIPTSIKKLSKSIHMPFYFSRSDLNKQYTQLQLEKHIAEIWRYYELLFRLNKEFENLRDKVLRDYNSLVTERDERHKVYANYVEDVNHGYAWAPTYKETIGNDYKSYNDKMHKIISEFI